jgi:hypothetical protein
VAVSGRARGDPVAVEEADHAALEDDRGRDVLAPLHDVRGTRAAGLLGAVGLVDDDGPAAAQHLRLEQRIAEPHRRLLQRGERLGGVARRHSPQWIASAMSCPSSMRLSTQRSSAERAARLGRRAVDDLADGPASARRSARLVHGLEDAQALEALLDLGGGQRCAGPASRSQLRARGGRPRPDAGARVASPRLGRDLEQVGDDDVALADCRWYASLSSSTRAICARVASGGPAGRTSPSRRRRRGTRPRRAARPSLLGEHESCMT